MARVDDNPLYFGSTLPEDLSAFDIDLSGYLPEAGEFAPEGRQATPLRTVNRDLPPEARALLDAIATDESPDYNTIYGGKKFDDYSRHPGAYVPIRKGPNAGKKSSAAGRYQFIEDTWNAQAAKLGLTDFSPENQDRAAWNYAQETYSNKTGRDLLADLKTGDPRFQQGITSALSSVWTSLPGGIENRSAAEKFLNRYTQSLAEQGVELPRAEAEDTYDIPLYDPEAKTQRTLTVPKAISREEALIGLREAGYNFEGLKEYPLTNDQTLVLPESMDINEALKELKAQMPDQEWMTKAHAEKTGFGAAAKAAFEGMKGATTRGVGEWLAGQGRVFGIEPLEAAGTLGALYGRQQQEEAAKGVERPLETDPLLQKAKFYGGSAAGAFLPMVAAAAAAPEAVVPAAMTGLMGAQATGSLAQRFDEQKQPFKAEEQTLPIAGETALQYAGNVVLGPLRSFIKSPGLGQLLGKDATTYVDDLIKTQGPEAAKAVVSQRALNIAKEAGLNISGMAAGDVGSMVIERVAAGQPLKGSEFEDELYDTLATDLLGGGVMGPVSGVVRQRQMEKRLAERAAPETPPVQGPAAPSPTAPMPEGGETLAPTEGPMESIEDLEAQAKEGEEFFRQAEAAGVTPEMAAPEAEIPEPTVRGREQAMPTVEEPAPLSFADLGLKGKNSKVLMRSLNELDMENPEHGKTINEILDRAEEANVQHNPETMQAIRAKIQEVKDAQQIPQAGAPDGRGGAQPGFREEGRDQAVSGEGVVEQGREERPAIQSYEKQKIQKTDKALAPISRRIDTILTKLFPDSVATNAELRPNLSDAKAINEQGFNNLNVDRQRVVLNHVLSMADNPKVAEAIVESIPVDMMDMLRRQEVTPEKLRHNPTVLRDLLTSSDKVPIPGFASSVIENMSRRAASISARAAAEKLSLRGKASSAELPSDFTPAIKTEEGVLSQNIPPIEESRENIRRQESFVKPEILEVRKFAKAEELTDADLEDETQVPAERIAKGLPLVSLVRGDAEPGIKSFRPSTDGLLGQGIYFTEHAEAAKGYGPHVSRSIVELRNPLVIDGDKLRGLEPHHIAEAIAEHPSLSDYFWTPGQARRWARQQAEDWAGIGDEEFPQMLRDSGHDGVVLLKDGKVLEATVLDPRQVHVTYPEDVEVRKEARGVAPEAAHSVETLNDHIVKTYGKNAPQVEVLTREQAGVEPNVKGFYDPNTKRVTLIADNIGKGEDVHGLMRHEVAVHAKRLGKTDPEFQSILDRLQKLKEQGDASVARAYDRVPKDTNPAHVHEEALAYLSQHAPNLPIVKSFTSWMRRMAHKLTGSADWLKADDFGPMADAILKRGEPAAPKAEGRMYSVGDAANDAVQNAATENWFERFYTPIRTKVVSVRAPLEAILGKLPLYDENNEIRATAKIAQQTRYAHLVSEALHTGFLARNKQGLIEAVFDPRLSPDQIINRVMELPEAVRDRFSESMVTLAQAGHNLRGAEMKAVMDEAQRKIKLGQAYLDKTKSDYEKTKSALDTIKDLSYRMKDNPRVQRELEKAQREFDAAKAEYRNPNYTAGKDYIATQQRLYRAVKDQFTKAKRNEAGHIYDISPEQEQAARQFLESNPEAKQLSEDIRELFTNNAKLLRDTGVISNETYKKFTDSKYNYAPLYMSIEDLDAAMPASAVYLQGGQRKVMPVKGLKGSPHQVKFFENLLTHQARTGAMALHNNARLGAMESLVEMGRAKELPGTTPPAKGVDVVAAIKDGKRRYYHVPDRPLYEAFEMVHNLPVPDWITDTTKFASRAMLVNPKYWWNQLVREPFMATFTTRAGVITPFHSGKEFASLLFSELPGVNTNAARLYRELKAQGVSGSHEYLRDLIKEKGKLQASKGLAKNYKDSRDLVMRIHEYADAATKVAVMRKALERAESGKLTGKPLQGEAARDAAITHVGEMINFANRGRSSTVQYITQATPFFNSWAQGMDAIIRSATGYGMDPHAKGSTIAGLRTTFIGHAAALMAFSAAITALRCEFSEDYREADPEEWSANWLIPLPESFETKKGRMVKAKGPFELNTLFKLGPEMWVRNWYGLDRGKDYTATLKSSIWRDIAPPGLDQLFMPYLPMLMLESATGYKVSEGEIKPLADMSLAPAERGKGVSPIADFLSGGPVSPAAVKNFGQGFFGGMYDMLDSTAKGAAAAFGSDTARADLRDLTEKVPVISGMLTNPDRIELGSAYEFADKQAMARHTAKVLTRRGEKEEAKEYAEEGRYAKQAEKIKRKISKTNTAIERLKNTKEYTDAEAIQREYEAQLEKKRKQVGRLEALRSKSEKD